MDVEMVRDVYARVVAMGPPLTDALADTLDASLARLELYPRAVRAERVEGIRELVVYVESPLLTGHRMSTTLVRRLATVLGALRSAVKVELVRWFARYSPPDLSRVVTLMQDFVTAHFAQNVKESDAVVAAVRALQMLYHANEASTPPSLPLSAFYNPAVATLNFKEEYGVWRRILDARAGGPPSGAGGAGGEREFSWFGYPFLMDAVCKTKVLRIDSMVQMSAEFEDAFVNHALVIHAQRFFEGSANVENLEERLRKHVVPYLVLEIRREHLVADVLQQITKKEKDLKKPLRVKFVGGGEEGMDQGGVQKEFFQVIMNNLLDPSYGLFTYDEQTRYSWINGWSLEPLSTFELVGVVLGLALFNGVIVDVHFPKLVFKKLLGEECSLEDVKDAFPALGKGLEQMLEWSDGDVSDVFMRSFEIDYDVYGKVQTHELVPKGGDITVTNENRAEFVALYVNHLTTVSVQRQFDALMRGFQKVCGGAALKMCRPDELELMICGSDDLNFEELEKATGYDGFAEDDQYVRDFWAIVHGMSQDQKKKLLTFVTASDRVPLKGLGNITFVVQRNGPDTDRLPTAMTCFGRILLPQYESKNKLRDRLLTAIENAKGFGLI
ncbi:HECT-domain-containing protein [Gonapodya prolifera JEL478]|uniref:HECT-type E3 ubiquitin transferase n=1 Tax=Gonapodya prolifera (strain JEL478) TaxID=1344416 RepID=A0A139A726_GONPJ|nr:HECT-domain-containing protein [Gonapodya prolifera JEL478]|eukprot:KXS12622.1 HECT-domain-containing protein [Gonapodya prolifera JEL478]